MAKTEIPPTKRAKSNYWAIIPIIVLLLIAVAVAMLLKQTVGTVDGVVFVALLLFPLIGYLVLADKITAFTGPGGWGITLKQAMTAPPAGLAVVDLGDNFQSVEKGSTNALANRLSRIDREKAVTLIIRLGAGRPYEERALERYLCELLAIREEAIVIFTDKSSKFIGSISANQLHSLFCSKITYRRKMFIEEIRSSSTGTINSIPIVTKFLKSNDSRMRALELFLETGAPALVIVDDAGAPERVAFRDQVAIRLLLSLTADLP